MSPLRLFTSPSGIAKLFLFSFSTILLVFLFTREDFQVNTSGISLPFVGSLSSSLSKSPSDMANSTAIDLGWYAPSQTLINNLTNVVSNSTSGVYGFIYNSSTTPDEEYGTYNWCNMPHVRAKEYVVPPAEYELVYVELVSFSPSLPLGYFWSSRMRSLKNCGSSVTTISPLTFHN